MNNSKSIVKQASILAIAAIIVRVIGLLYRSPLIALIGDEGNGYYSTAYNIYTLILLISSYSIPSAISKLVSQEIASHRYKNAKLYVKYAFYYVLVVGIAAALVLFILAPFIVTKPAVLALRVLCPTIVLSGIVGILRGYFQAYSKMIHTSISQIVEQFFNAIVSVGAAFIFIQPYLSNGTLKASFGAAGSALGTGIGVLVAFIYLLFVYLKKQNKEEDANEDNQVDTPKKIIYSILNIVTPIIIATCVYNLVNVIDMSIYYYMTNLKGLSPKLQSIYYSVYTTKFVVIMNLPLSLASAMSTASIPAISSNYAINNRRELRKSMMSAINIIMLILIPASVGLSILAYPIMLVLFPQKETIHLASSLLSIGAFATIFYGLSTVSNGILQALGAVKVPVRNAIHALIVHVVLLVIALFLLPASLVDYSPYILLTMSMIYAIQMCITNQKALYKITKFPFLFKKIILIPLIASLIMAVICKGSYMLIMMIYPSNFIALIISVILSMITYLICILFFYSNRLEDLESIPYMSRITRRLKK